LIITPEGLPTPGLISYGFFFGWAGGCFCFGWSGGCVVALDFAGGKAEVGRHQVRQDFLAEDRKSGSLSGLPMFYGYRRLNKLLVSTSGGRNQILHRLRI
jgi:hypothetical protein